MNDNYRALKLYLIIFFTVTPKQHKTPRPEGTNKTMLISLGKTFFPSTQIKV